MNQKTLGWFGLLIVIAIIGLVSYPYNHDPVIEQQTELAVPAQPWVANGATDTQDTKKLVDLAAALQKSKSILEKSIDVRRRLSEKQTPEDKARRAKLKLTKYQEFISSLNLPENKGAESLSIILDRDKEEDEIDQAMFSKKLDVFQGGKEKKKIEQRTFEKLTGVIGLELAGQFVAWDKKSRRASRSN